MLSPVAFIICVVSGKLGKDTASFAKKSGASLVLLDEEVFSTSKLEYAITQTIQSSFLPVKTADLVAGSTITFDVFHLLPLRGKFIKFLFNGDVLDEARFKKLTLVGELYVDRHSVDALNNYTKENQKMSASGLAGRCRSQFLALYVSYSQLALLLTDQSEHGSFTEGERLLTKCKDMSGALLATLAEFGNAWEIINNSAIGAFGSVERAPAVAAYAGLHAMLLGMPAVDDLMMAALFSDLGLLLLPPSVSKKLRENRIETMTPEEREAYRAYPNRSLEVLLGRRISLPESIRSLLLATNEWSDGSGFPKGLGGKKIPEGALMVGFCREFDRRTLIRLGEVRADHEAVRSKIIDEEVISLKHYPVIFLDKMKREFC